MAELEERMHLLKRIREIEFVALELNLYLDTHPDDTQALQHFNRAADELAELKKQYEQCYGPLLNYGFGKNPGNTWLWAQTPWPWEM